MKTILFCLFIFLFSRNSKSQICLDLADDEKLSFTCGGYKPLHSSSASSDKMLGSLTYVAIAAFVINPMLVLENKKVYFALTKEISVGKYPYGRLGFEYSFIFRDSLKSHMRISYNYDVILEAGDFFVFVLTPGTGYFTDTKNNGWFGHTSFGVLFATENFGVNPYFRYRFTYITDKKPNKSNIHDISLGMGIVFYY